MNRESSKRLHSAPAFQFSLRTAFILISAGTLLAWWWVPGEVEVEWSGVEVRKWTAEMKFVRITTLDEVESWVPQSMKDRENIPQLWYGEFFANLAREDLVLLPLNGLAGEQLALERALFLDQVGIIDCKDTPLADVVLQITDAVKRNECNLVTISGPEDLGGVTVDFLWNDRQLREALDDALERVGLTYYVLPCWLIITTRTAAQEFDPPSLLLSSLPIVDLPEPHSRSRLGGQLLFILPWPEPQPIDSRAGAYFVPKGSTVVWVTETQLLWIDIGVTAGVCMLVAFLILADRRSLKKKTAHCAVAYK